jgi:glutathione-regulated potassium-efflux system ancillary protein KefC
MTTVLALAALWLGPALIVSLILIWFRIPTALSEVIVGTSAQLVFGATVGSELPGPSEAWVKFLSTAGAIFLTFLAGDAYSPCSIS